MLREDGRDSALILFEQLILLLKQQAPPPARCGATQTSRQRKQTSTLCTHAELRTEPQHPSMAIKHLPRLSNFTLQTSLRCSCTFFWHFFFNFFFFGNFMVKVVIVLAQFFLISIDTRSPSWYNYFYNCLMF